MDNRKASLLAAFAADSLSLGAHWIYDVQEIEKRFGRVEDLAAPGPDSYHKGKKQGEFTHYGDQMLVLLESVAEKHGFDLHGFSERWRELFVDYKGYLDGATKKTLAYYAKGKGPEKAGSHTGDFAGASRIAPVVFMYADDLDGMVDAARAQTKMTHNDAATLDTAEFFARVAYRTLQGQDPVEAVEETAAMEDFEMNPVSMWVSDGLKSKDQDTVSAIGRFGQACETNQVFPGVVHLIAKYRDDLREALIQAVMAGGDSSARGSMAAMVLGARHGMDSIPKEWISGMKKGGRILELADKLAKAC